MILYTNKVSVSDDVVGNSQKVDLYSANLTAFTMRGYLHVFCMSVAVSMPQWLRIASLLYGFLDNTVLVLGAKLSNYDILCGRRILRGSAFAAQRARQIALESFLMRILLFTIFWRGYISITLQYPLIFARGRAPPNWMAFDSSTPIMPTAVQPTPISVKKTAPAIAAHPNIGDASVIIDHAPTPSTHNAPDRGCAFLHPLHGRPHGWRFLPVHPFLCPEWKFHPF